MSTADTKRRWGPSHQEARPSRRRPLEWVVIAVGVCVLLPLLHDGLDPGGGDFAVWSVKALAVGALIWVALVAIASGWNPLHRFPAGRGSATSSPSEGTTAGQAARAEIARLGGGAYLGTSGGHWVTADPESAVMVLGPPRSGKTSAVMIPAVMSAGGAVISTSTKPEVMRASAIARGEVGQCWCFDPAASERNLPGGVRRLGWSPVAAAASWDEALVTARAMAACTRPGAGTTNEDHWSERAAALLAPLLHAANLIGQPIEAVLRWVLSQEVEPARLALLDTDAEIAAHVLDGIERTDSRERSSIFSAAAGVLAAYNSDAVRRAAASPNFDPVRFACSTDTIYITAPEHRQALCAPLIVGLLEQIRHAVYERSAREEGDGPPMLWALDEIANIAPIHDLPALISQAGGQGLQVMVGLQDLSQARARWGTEVAEGFLSLFQTKLVLSGIGDPRTLEAISLALGEYDRQVVSRTMGTSETDRWLDPHGYNESTSWQMQRQRVVPPGEVAQLPSGRGLLLRGAEWGLVGLTRWFEGEL